MSFHFFRFVSFRVGSCHVISFRFVLFQLMLFRFISFRFVCFMFFVCFMSRHFIFMSYISRISFILTSFHSFHSFHFPPARWRPTYFIRVASFLLPTANSKSQRALRDLKRELQIAVGPQLQAPDLSGHCHWDLAVVEVRQCPCQREWQKKCQIMPDGMPDRTAE